MLKIKVKRVIMAFAIFAVLIFISIGTFARYSTDTNKSLGMANWNVKITNDTKDDLNSEDTQDIIFKVPNNPNVASGKIAPGTTAVATIELDLSRYKCSSRFGFRNGGRQITK